MTQRRLDLALLVGIGVLLLLIVVLALSAAPRAGVGDISDPVPREPVEELTPTSEAASEATSGAAPENDSEPASAPETATEPENAGAGAETTGAEETGTGASGTSFNARRIERIGFAYATGTPGACGVPLTAWNYVALSRDLLEAYPCGTAVTLSLEDEVAGRREVVAQVGDTMGADITDTVNIFVNPDEPALEYGVTSGTLSP